MATTTKANPEWFINVNKLPDGITVLHAPFSCMLFIITSDKNYAAIKNAQMRIRVVERDLFKEQKASIAAKHGCFQAYLRDDGDLDSSFERNTVLQAQSKYFWFCLSSCSFLVLSTFGKIRPPPEKP